MSDYPYSPARFPQQKGGPMATPNLSAHRIGTVAPGTRAKSDAELVTSWVDNLRSGHSQRNFAKTAGRFLEALPVGIRKATVEDVREALAKITEGLSASTAQQAAGEVAALLRSQARLHGIQRRGNDQGAA